VRRVTEVAEVVRTPDGLQFLPMLSYDGHYHLSERFMPLIARIASGWGMGYEEGLANLHRRIELRRVLLDMGREDPSYLSPASILAANEYLWQGNGGSAADFISYMGER